MAAIKNVLLVTNATTESETALIKEAFVQARKQGMEIKLSLVHVIPNLPTCYFNIPSMALLTERYYEEAKQSLAKLGESLDVPKSEQWLISGRINSEVPRLADRLNTDFILASSNSIQDLHKSFLFIKSQKSSRPIRSISSLVAL